MAINESVLQALLDSVTPMNETTPYAKIMIFGESGTGKTIAAARAVQKRGLFIDSGEGWVSLMDFPELRAKMQRMEYQGLSQLEAFMDAFEQGISPWSDFDTVILDECSTIAVLDLDVVLAQRSAKDASKDPNVATLPDYGANTERMRRTLTRLLKLPVSVVLTSHFREDKDERTGVLYVRPNFTPKLRNTIMQWLHVCGHLTITEETSGDEVQYVRKLQVRPSKSIAAKTRIGSLPNVLVDPDLGEIIQMWQNSGAALQDEKVELIPDIDAPVVSDSSLVI